MAMFNTSIYESLMDNLWGKIGLRGDAMFQDNFDMLLSDLDGDLELLEEIINDLNTQLDEMRESTLKALEVHDYGKIAKCIHKIKGALMNFRDEDTVSYLNKIEEDCLHNTDNSISSRLNEAFEIIESMIGEFEDYKTLKL